MPVVAAGTSSASSGGTTGDKLALTDRPVPVQIPSSEKEHIGMFELSKSDSSKAVDVVAVHSLQGMLTSLGRTRIILFGSGTYYLQRFQAQEL